MGMSTHVVGFKLPDDKWKKMKAIWDSCENADIEIPDEVMKYFNYEEPDTAGVEVDIETEEWSDDCCSGYQIYVEKIPKDIKIIRFYNSW